MYNIDYSKEREETDRVLSEKTHELNEKYTEINEALGTREYGIIKIKEINKGKLAVLQESGFNFLTTVLAVGITYGGVYLLTRNLNVSALIGSSIGIFSVHEYRIISEYLESKKKHINRDIHLEEIRNQEKIIERLLSEYNNISKEIVDYLIKRKNEIADYMKEVNVISSFEENALKELIEYYETSILREEISVKGLNDSVKLTLKENNIPY